MKRLYTLDIFRIICAIVVFMFHAHISVDIYTNFGIFNNFISYGHIFMTAFFMLSGFGLYYSNYEKNIANRLIGGVAKFYIKRLAGIYPLYFFSALTYIFFFNKLSIIQNLVLIPLEVTLLQSIYQGSFYVSHFGGTWFISNIFICYLLFPFLKTFPENNSKKENIFLLVFIWLFLSYSFILIYFFNFAAIYTNPIIRFLEFFSGMIIADLFYKNKSKDIQKRIKVLIPIIGIFFITTISVVIHFKTVPLDCFTIIAIPIFGTALYLCARIETQYSYTKYKKLISVLSENSYAFFLAQFFTWDFVKKINNNYLHLNNALLFIFCLVWCSAITLCMHYCIERPCKKLILRLVK